MISGMRGCFLRGYFAQSIESAQFYVQRRLIPRSDFRERARTGQLYLFDLAVLLSNTVQKLMFGAPLGALAYE